MESPWGLGCWATVQSVIPGVESSGAHEPVEAFQAQQILARLELPPAGRRRVVAKRKPRPVPGSKTRRVMSLFWLVVLHLVFLHFVFLYFLVRLVVVLCFDVFLFVHRLVHLVHRFSG